MLVVGRLCSVFTGGCGCKPEVVLKKHEAYLRGHPLPLFFGFCNFFFSRAGTKHMFVRLC